MHTSSPCVASAAALLVTLLATAPSRAQSYVVSPAQYTTAEAAASTDTPFGGYGRYQQIHGDLRGVARSLAAIAWRRDGIVGPNAFFVARSPDMEIALASSNLAATSATFASNVVGAATTVFARRSVSGPDLTTQPPTVPAPFNFQLVFDAPYSYAGTTDLVYDFKIYTNTSGNPYPFDAASGRDSSTWGGFTSVGNGCSTANGFMSLRSGFLSNASTSQLTLQWAVDHGPTNQPAAVLLGFSNPNVFSPMLCRGYYLYTDAAVTVIGGATDALGRFTTALITVGYRPGLVGAALTAQAGAIDFSQGGFNVAASNGITSAVAATPVPLQVSRVYALSAPSATTGTVNVGYGMVTRFQY